MSLLFRGYGWIEEKKTAKIYTSIHTHIYTYTIEKNGNTHVQWQSMLFTWYYFTCALQSTHECGKEENKVGQSTCALRTNCFASIYISCRVHKHFRVFFLFACKTYTPNPSRLCHKPYDNQCCSGFTGWVS